ncbi:MAG: RNA methyltransferase [Terriglobia bacterium]
MSEVSWRVVLVRPRNPLNIGAAARAMANFGFSDLAVVAPYAPVWSEVRSAVGAERIMRSARRAESLMDAIGGATLVVGTTSGARRALGRPLISLDELAAWLDEQREHHEAALLFGSEKTGLSNEDLSYCHALVRIPTTFECPSMNLGQAVAVCCFELAREQKKKQGERESAEAPENRPVPRFHISAPAGAQSLEHILKRAVRVLDETGYLKPGSREATLIKLRRTLVRRGLSNDDAKILGGILAQIEWKLKIMRSGSQ